MSVPIEKQVIVNFDSKFFQGNWEDTYRALLPKWQQFATMQAPLLKLYVARTSTREAFFAMGVMRIDDPQLTIDQLQATFAGDATFEPNVPVVLDDFDDPRLAEQWALATLEATGSWSVQPAGGKTMVAIVDSGLYRGDNAHPLHEDLGAVEPLVDCQPQPVVIDGIKVFPGLHLDGIDQDGHGTLLAGTMAAVPGNGRGVASAIEQSWNISLLPVKFFSPGAGPNAADAAIAIAHAVDQGAKVINLSWHVPPGKNLKVLRHALHLALANDRLIVIAAGNDGTDNEVYPTWPAKLATEHPFKNKVLTVLASDRDDSKAGFSNYGASTVHLAAPGADILATGLYLEPPARYASYSGTSPAAAYASAAAALVFALNPAWQPEDVVRHLRASARTVDALRLACLDGKRLDIGRAVYGPLRLLSPRAGDELPANQATPIVWSNSYSNATFDKVKIEFDDGTGWTVVKASTPNDGLFSSWKPATATTTGRIRLTPVAGNFPVVSETFRVV
jgi:subtilisin family serine protease